MRLKRSAQHTLISTGTALINVPVLAHSGHFENKKQTETKETDTLNNQAESNPSSKEQQSPSFKQSQEDHQSQPNTDSPQEQSSSTNHSQKANRSPSNTHQNKATSTSKTNNQTTTQAVEEQSTTQAQIVTISKIPPLGETILGLIVAAPFFLYALRKRIHQ